jgi:hypothetical protein
LIATAAVAAAQLRGIVPELSLVGGLAAPLPAPNAKVRGRDLFGRELDGAVREATARGGAAPFYAYLARAGFRDAPTESMGASIDASDGTHIGSTVVMTFHDRQRSATARVVHQLGANEMKTSMAIWSDDQPLLLTVFRAAHGDARKLGTITIGDADIVVDDLESGRVTLPRRMPARSAAGKAGTFAAVPPTAPESADSVCQEICGWVVGSYCGLVCEYSFFVVCSVILALTLPSGLFCFLVAFGVCFTTCYTVQQWACSSVCG